MRLRKDLRAARIKEAGIRATTWAELTPKQKLESLDSRLGKGIGAKRQRVLLEKALV